MPYKKEREARKLAKGANKIYAIKLLRDANENLGLKEAKDIVESWGYGHPASEPITPQAQPEKKTLVLSGKMRVISFAEENELQKSLGDAINDYREQYGDNATKDFIRGFLNCTIY